MRELPHEHQTQAERRVESERAAAAKAREEHRDAVERLAATYARITADPEAAVAILDYVGRREPRLDAETLREMRRALEIAAAPEGDYLAVPDAVRSRCVLMCFELDARGDSRLLDIIDRAEGRSAAGRAIYDDQELARSDRSAAEPVNDPEMDFERGPGRRR